MHNKLINKNFILLWQGQLMGQLGLHVLLVAVMFWVKHVTQSASLMGMLLAAALLPAVLLGPVAGAVADRYSRKYIIVISDVVSALAILTLTWIISTATEIDGIVLALLLFIAAVLGVAGAFLNPAISAAVPDLVPPSAVTQANAIIGGIRQLALLLGQGLGGVLFRLLGAPLLSLCIAMSYLISALLELFMDIPQEKLRISEDSTRQSIFAQFKAQTREGFRHVWGNQGMRGLFFSAAFVNFFSTPIITLLPFYVEDILQVSPDWYGLLVAAFGVGMVVGLGVAGMVKLPPGVRAYWMIAALLAMALSLGSLGLISTTVLSLLALCMAGMMSGFVNIHVVTVLQIQTPAAMRGRVFGFLGTLTGALVPLSIALAGVAADLSGKNIALIYLVCGGMTLICTVITALSQEFRAFFAYQISENTPID